MQRQLLNIIKWKTGNTTLQNIREIAISIPATAHSSIMVHVYARDTRHLFSCSYLVLYTFWNLYWSERSVWWLDILDLPRFQRYILLRYHLCHCIFPHWCVGNSDVVLLPILLHLSTPEMNMKLLRMTLFWQEIWNNGSNYLINIKY